MPGAQGGCSNNERDVAGHPMVMNIRSEHLAYWFLRLNGFLTTSNFIVHPDRGENQETDVDVFGVRFPHRAENMQRPMKDHPHFTLFCDKPLIVIAEVKRRCCALNEPWTDPARQNMLRVLRAIGAFPSAESEVAAEALHDHGHHAGKGYYVSLLCLGGEHNTTIAERYPQIPQILWREVLGFVYHRFREYRVEKRSHAQWDEQGRALWNTSENSCDEERFTENVHVL